MNVLKKSVSFLTAVAVMLFTAAFFSVTQKNTDVASAYSFEKYVNNVAALVNEYRQQNGLSPLAVIPVLQENAQTRAVEVSQNFSHTRPNGGAYKTAISSSLPKYTWGENIAYGATTPESVMDQWKHSAGHNNNMLSSKYTHIGVGAYISGGTIYWVQLFIGSGMTFDGEYMPAYSTEDTTAEITTEQPPVVLPDGSGDVNFDGKIDSRDAVLILQDYAAYLTGKNYTIPLTYGDVNSDDKIDSTDAVLILIYYAQHLVKG